MTAPSQTKTNEKKPIHILIVDDELALLDLLRISLEKTGYLVTTAAGGTQALELFQDGLFDLVLLDIIMPQVDGFAICAELRKRSNVPIVMLTALNQSDDIVRGFSLGADDYITKPFTFREVEMRITSILRRIEWTTERTRLQILAFDDIVLDDDLREVHVRGEPVHLTPIEFQLLRYLMQQPDRPASKEDLFQNVWGYNLAGGTNLVEVAVRRLREKIEEDPSDPRFLKTVHGAGYKFRSGQNNEAVVARTSTPR